MAPMAVLRIAVLGHPVLRQIAEPIPVDRIPSSDVQGLISDMYQTMEDYQGAGLAAPQVQVSARVVICSLTTGDQVLINPIIVNCTEDQIASYEGCLSVPNMRGLVDRCAHIQVTGYDENGQQLNLDLQGWDAIVVQHECDHLDGILYIDRCDTTTLAFNDEFLRFGPLKGEEEE